MDDRRRTPSDGKSSHCFWQGELKNGKVSILLICGKHLHHITSLRGEVWAHRTSLIPPLYIEVPVLSLESEGVYVWCICTCIRGIDFIYVCTIFRLYLGTVLTVWYYFFYCKAILFVLGLGFWCLMPLSTIFQLWSVLLVE
jgi:hypothetical protein